MSAGIFLVLLGLVCLLNRHLAQVAAEAVRTKVAKGAAAPFLFAHSANGCFIHSSVYLFAAPNSSIHH